MLIIDGSLTSTGEMEVKFSSEEEEKLQELRDLAQKAEHRNNG